MIMPCEKKPILPAIRKEVIVTLIRKYGLTQKQVSTKTGLTEAAISFYVRNKRGYKVKFNKKVQKKIKDIARKIFESKSYQKDICGICRMIRRELK